MDDVGGSATNADAAFLCHQDSIAICNHLSTKSVTVICKMHSFARIREELRICLKHGSD